LSINADDDIDWRTELWRGLRKRLRDYRRKFEHPLKEQLENDQSFVLKEHDIRKDLVGAYKKNPGSVRKVLAAYRSGPHAGAEAHNRLIKSVRDPSTRRMLNRYRKFAIQFRVTFVLREIPGIEPIFKKQFWPILGRECHGKVERARLVPISDDPTETLSYAELLASSPPEFVRGLEPDLKELDDNVLRHATFLQVDDKTGSSILSDIEEIGYTPSGVCFVYHKSKVPYLFWLLGEEVLSEKTLKPLLKLITAFQKQYHGRQKRGRKPNVKNLRKTLNVIDKPGVLKEKASDLATDEAAGNDKKKTDDKAVWAKQMQLFRAKKLRKKKFK